MNKSSALVVCGIAIVGLFLGITYFSIQTASAISCNVGANPATIDCSVSASEVGNLVSLRDVSDTSNVTQTATVQLDKSRYGQNDSGQLTIVDVFANLSSSIQDTIIAKLTTTSDPSGISLVATEDGVSTSTFVGAFSTTDGPSTGTSLHVQRGDQINVVYTPAEIFSPRVQITFDNAGSAGNVILQDLKLTSDDEINNGFSTVIESANFTLVNGATLNPGDKQHIVISYANSQLGCLVDKLSGCNTDNLSLWVSSPALSTFHTFVEIAGASSVTNDPVAKTVSFDYDLTSIDASTSGSWIFVLAFDTGGIGGSGGGIVRAGLVLNLLAGIGGASEHSVTPPSFGGGSTQYSDGLTLTQGNETDTFDISKYNQELPRQVMVTGLNTNMTFKTYEGYNHEGVVHMGLFIIPRGEDMITTNSIASIQYEKYSPVQINDPNHILSNVTASSSSDGKFQYTQFLFVPQKSYDKMSFLVRAWNDHLLQTDARVHDDVNIQQYITQPSPYIKVYDNIADLQRQLEEDGYAKPYLLGHIHDTTSVFNNGPGKVSWIYDTSDKTITLLMEEEGGKVVGMRSESLVEQTTPPQNQNFLLGDTYYSHHSLSRLNVDEIESTKSTEELKALALMTGLYGQDYVSQYDFLGKQ